MRGANIPAILRAIVACGWFGIQGWIGGRAIYSMLEVLWPAAANHAGVGWVCFFASWLLNMIIIWRGIETIKFLEGVGAPFMLGVGLLLLSWITRKAGGLGPIAGIMIADYFFLRRETLSLDSLYRGGGAYEYFHGFNFRAIAALALGIAVALVGLIVHPLRWLYDYAWFVGFFVSAVSYIVLMPRAAALNLQVEPTPATNQ